MGPDRDWDRAERTMADDTPASTAHASTELPSSEGQPTRSSKEAPEDVMALEPQISGEKSGDEAPRRDDPSADEYPKGLPLLFTVLAIILGIFLASLDMTIVATAIPKITDDFGGIDLVSWYGSAFFMTNGGFQSSWGKAYKYFPLKHTYVAAILVFEVGSLICALAPNAPVLIAGRAVCGIGAAGIGTGAYTIIGFAAEPSKRAAYTGLVGLSHGVASVLGPLIGGVFSDHVTWRWCFWINLPIGGLSALTVLLFFKPPASARPTPAAWREKLLQMDPLGVGLVMGAILCYLLALQYGGEAGSPWGTGRVIGLLVGFVVLCVTFGLWERWQRERAMVVPRLFGRRAIGLSVGFTLFFSGSYFLVIYYLPIYFQSVHGTSPTMSGVYNLPLILVVSVSMITSGIVIGKWNVAVPLMIAGCVIAVVGSALFYTFETDSSLGHIVGYQLLGGLGWGLAFQVPIIVSQASVDAQDLSCVTAMVLFFMNLGGTSFVSAAQCAFVNVMANTLSSRAPAIDPAEVILTGATRIRDAFSLDEVPLILDAYTEGIKTAFSIAIGSTGVALILSLFYGREMTIGWTRKSAKGDEEASPGKDVGGKGEIPATRTYSSDGEISSRKKSIAVDRSSGPVGLLLREQK